MAVNLDRRTFLTTALAGAAELRARRRAGAARRRRRSRPCRRRATGPRQEPIQYPDPDIIALDPRFRRYIVGNTSISGCTSARCGPKGPAWNGVGRYLVWSDIPNNVQMRWTEEDGRVTVFRNPSGYSNGNTFDFEGRQLSCEHGGRRVVRYEHERHGDRDRREVQRQAAELAERRRRASRTAASGSPIRPTASAATTRASRASRRPRKPSIAWTARRCRSRRSPTNQSGPNGICFSPDYKKLYVADTGTGRDIRVYDVDGKSLRNGKRFVQLDIPGTGAPRPPTASAATWTATSGRARGPGVQVVAPDGDADRHDPSARNVRQRLLRRVPPAIGCSWPPASRSTRCTSRRRAPISPE